MLVDLVDNASQARDFETRTLPLLAELYQLAAGLTPTRRTAEDVTVQAYQRAFQQFAEAPPANSRLLMLKELIAAARRQRRWNWWGSSAGGSALDLFHITCARRFFWSMSPIAPVVRRPRF